MKNKTTELNEEILLDPYKTIMSKTDNKGIIEYANDYFMEVSGYKEWELMGQPHNILRHSKMPKVIFKLLWDYLNVAKPIKAIVKNLAKDGRYYWVVADFKTLQDENGKFIARYAKRKAVPSEVKEKVEKLYNILLEIEKASGMEASEAYLKGMLEEEHLSYDDFILNLFGLSEEQLNEYMSSEISDEMMTGSDRIVSAEEAIKKTSKKGLFGRIFN